MATILLAEDEPHIMRVMSLWLQRHGHVTIETANGLEALEALDRGAVDLMISDANMPGLDGESLIRAVREERALRIPIVMITARCDQSKVAEAMKAYGVHLLPKPFVPSRLVTQIDRLLAAPAA
ncbi:MAG: response regulator [Phycisphaerae bacterium]